MYATGYMLLITTFFLDNAPPLSPFHIDLVVNKTKAECQLEMDRIFADFKSKPKKVSVLSTKGQLEDFYMEAIFNERPNEKVYYHCEPYFDYE